jgi:hypothetical protein
MAKRKNAAALFEVIHTDNRFPSRHDRAPSSSRKGWFHRTARSADAPAPMERIERSEPQVPAGPSIVERLAAGFASLPRLLPPIPRFVMKPDPERLTVRFQLSYTAAAIGGFAVVAAVALAFVVGRQVADRPRPALAEAATDDLLRGPANPDVLNIGSDDDFPPAAMATGSSPTTPRGLSSAAAAPVPAPSSANQPTTWSQPAKPTTLVVTDSKRTVGLTYVVIQSYPKSENKMADDAVKLLNGNGLLCTTETTPFAPSWISVVGITGFDRIRDSAEYDQYIARIVDISNSMAGTLKFKRFDPKPFKWREMKRN